MTSSLIKTILQCLLCCFIYEAVCYKKYAAIPFPLRVNYLVVSSVNMNLDSSAKEASIQHFPNMVHLFQVKLIANYNFTVIIAHSKITELQCHR